MPSSSPHYQIIRAIDEIKQLVDGPPRCGWLENPYTDEGRRLKARRYKDGALQIMDLLHTWRTPEDVQRYATSYNQLREVPESRATESLSSAKDLWRVVLEIEERITHSRIIAPPEPDESARRLENPPASASGGRNPDEGAIRDNQRQRHQRPGNPPQALPTFNSGIPVAYVVAIQSNPPFPSGSYIPAVCAYAPPCIHASSQPACVFIQPRCFGAAESHWT
ncbi:hypothetical protein C8Q78DRAFT_505379 [Trametes maxima]|nr:hypothetical protein C8Q78DRAFT_505379 [Trametes maxima]